MLLKNHILHVNGAMFHAAVGRGGIRTKLREGDGVTPLGSYLLRECWYRADRIEKPRTHLPLRVISPDDGWCDDVANAEYNRHVKLPFSASHEKLWREDYAYDLIIPIGYNDNPVVAGKGSAIFMHIAQPDYAATEGCIALSLADWREILPHLDTDSRITIEE